MAAEGVSGAGRSERDDAVLCGAIPAGGGCRGPTGGGGVREPGHDEGPTSEDWDLLVSFFPDNWRDLAVETGALRGLRKDKSPEKLLRTLLIHLGCGIR